MTTQREKLEKEIDELNCILESNETYNRQRITNELRQKLDELTALDNGDHWTQTKSDTLRQIVIHDLQVSTKKIIK